MKQDNIIYPPLVEQAYEFVQRNGVNADKALIYTQMIDANYIDKYGNPTKEAIKAGLIDEYVGVENGEAYPVSLQVFKREYPIYADYEDRHFTWDDKHGWLIDSYVMRGIANNALNDPDSTEEQRQMAYHLLEQAKRHED